MSASFHFSPLLDTAFLYPAFAIVTVGVFLVLGGGKAARWRIIAFAALLLALLNPVTVHEKKQSLPDIALVVVDRSVSQNFGERLARTDAALTHLRGKLDKIENLKTEVIETGSTRKADEGEGTYLFEAVRQALSRIPREQSAGIVFLTDGQVHDAANLEGAGPVHAVLTGSRSEKDRAIVMEGKPSYGVVGGNVEFLLKVRESGSGGAGDLTLHVARDGETIDVLSVPADESVTLSYSLPHGGKNFFEFSVDAAPGGELTLVNNRAVVSVNGVRDRLKVLLISGKPYPGERIWRNLLKSDASVDLVHFTILRSPEKIDPTPNNELSLIAFPVDELFSEKIRDFDLIIFDRYEFRGVLSPVYIRNIADFVRGGGGLLMAGGPDYVSKDALYQTALKEILPAKPLGDQVIEHAFLPKLTEKGRRHPVTAALDKPENKPVWGHWFRQARVDPDAGTVLMSGADDLPLLILDRVENGRVAQLTSDEIWLWAKGIDGGGPHTEILRRLVHWLMKEPELEENSLKAHIADGKLIVDQMSIEEIPPSVTAAFPSGAIKPVEMTDNGKDGFSGTLAADEDGVYKVSSGKSVVFVATGDLSSPELSDIESTDEIILPVTEKSGGKSFWYDEDQDFGVRILDGSRNSYEGRGWIGLRRNHADQTLDVTQAPLFPSFAGLGLLMAALLGAWLREGRRGL